MLITRSICANESISLSTRQFQFCVLEQLRAVKSHGEVVDLNISGHGVNAQDSGTRAGVRGQTGFLIQATTKFL